MTFDFTTILDRRGKDALAVDALGTGFAPGAPKEGFDPIPMWVADMNFAVPPSIQEAVAGRLAHPAFGYFENRPEYYQAIIDWQSRRNGAADLRPEHIGYENGVLGGVISALGAVCARGERVLLHSPTYIGFTNSLSNAGYRMTLSPLARDEEGVWRMDLADMERRIVKYGIRAAIFCSPHNPCGRVWERWEVEQAMELFRKYDVTVISDEIWSDLIRPGLRHVPTQSVSRDARNRTVALYAPSKTFNLAGLIGAYHIVYNDKLRQRMDREAALCHYNSMNVLSMYALMGAYSEQGEQWLDQLREVLAGNLDYAVDFIRENFPGVEAFRPEGTYMLFLDCTQWCADRNMTLDALLRKCWDVGVALQDGRPFHGPCHIRMNLALPLSRVQEAFSRLEQYVFCK